MRASTETPPLCSIRTLQADESNHALRRINLTSGLVTTVAGRFTLSPPYNYGNSDGVGSAVSFYFNVGVAIDAAETFTVVVSWGWVLLCV